MRLAEIRPDLIREISESDYIYNRIKLLMLHIGSLYVGRLSTLEITSTKVLIMVITRDTLLNYIPYEPRVADKSSNYMGRSHCFIHYDYNELKGDLLLKPFTISLGEGIKKYVSKLGMNENIIDDATNSILNSDYYLPYFNKIIMPKKHKDKKLIISRKLIYDQQLFRIEYSDSDSSSFSYFPELPISSGIEFDPDVSINTILAQRYFLDIGKWINNGNLLPFTFFDKVFHYDINENTLKEV